LNKQLLKRLVIIQRAEATAMVLQYQAQATLLIQNANAPASAPDQTAYSPSPGIIQVPITPQGTNTILQATTPPTQAVEESEVKLLGVSLGTESGLILVQFKAPPALARHWQQICTSSMKQLVPFITKPVMPVIGPLFARPNCRSDCGGCGQCTVPLQSGALVIVYLGEYIFEHVQVK
jgi:hypothetical protein